MRKYFAWFFFVSGFVGLAKMVLGLVDGPPPNLSGLELWAGWLLAFPVNALCFYLWYCWK